MSIWVQGSCVGVFGESWSLVINSVAGEWILKSSVLLRVRILFKEKAVVSYVFVGIVGPEE